MFLLLKNENIGLKSKIYHIFNGRVTKIFIVLGLIIGIYIGLRLNKPIDWFYDRITLLLIIYGLRRAWGHK